ncbi:MAG: hypothetical protein AMS27_03975 [Bacteroides sp. SM23_62_1]|nr:MAG: hypothetical protein AMS27_03975 [Bacteroides sp. SM23_62_1]
MKPILEKKVVTISTGHTIHQTRPKKIADKIINGHHNLQIKLVVRLVLLRRLKKASSLVYAENPMITNPRKARKVIILKQMGNHLFASSLFILLSTMNTVI